LALYCRTAASPLAAMSSIKPLTSLGTSTPTVGAAAPEAGFSARDLRCLETIFNEFDGKSSASGVVYLVLSTYLGCRNAFWQYEALVNTYTSPGLSSSGAPPSLHDLLENQGHGCDSLPSMLV
jgi:hypothetical protein